MPEQKKPDEPQKPDPLLSRLQRTSMRGKRLETLLKQLNLQTASELHGIKAPPNRTKQN